MVGTVVAGGVGLWLGLPVGVVVGIVRGMAVVARLGLSVGLRLWVRLAGWGCWWGWRLRVVLDFVVRVVVEVEVGVEVRVGVVVRVGVSGGWADGPNFLPTGTHMGTCTPKICSTFFTSKIS